MKILFASAEIFPFAKSGGLADISYALPKAMRELADVTTLMPLYRFIDKERYGIRPTGEHFTLRFGGTGYDVELFKGGWEAEEAVFVYNPLLCDRDHLYGPPGEGYEDNDLRFAIFCHAIVETARRYAFTLLHLNDWHTAPAALLARDAGLRAKSVFTIHNLAYQGIFPPESLKRTGIAQRHFCMEELEFFGQVNWMKGGIAHADAVTTVSPSYAVEIQEPEYGCGLDGFLRKHNRKLKGILNGIDTEVFNPSSDAALPENYDEKSLEGKDICKRRFLGEINIDKYEYPLFVFIGRFVEQKGIDLLIDTIEEAAKRPIVLALLGDGSESVKHAVEEAVRSKETLYCRFGYDEAFSHRMYAAADFLLMPSRFEPCGLNQMIAMRYGTIPLVHGVGGLRDTVHKIEPSQRICGQGFVFTQMKPASLLAAMDDAVKLYHDKNAFKQIRAFDMRCDFSVKRCAKEYLKLYEGLV